MAEIVAKKFRPKSESELRKFGFIMGFMFLLISGLSIWKHAEITRLAVVMLTIGLVFAVLAISKPILLARTEKLWMRLGEKLGSLMTVVILTLIYYLIVTPLGCITRLMGEDLLKLKMDKKAETYWIKRGQVTARYYKPY